MPTIGVSLAVPDPWGTELQQHRLGFGDEAARHIPTHVTLLPPYAATDDEVAELRLHLEVVASLTTPFRVHLRGTGTFRPVSPVVFVNVVEGIADCEQLSAAVLRGPLLIDRAFPYHPHVTVAHHLDDPTLDRAFAELADYETSFDIDCMWLYLHDEVLGWQPEAAYELGGLGL